MKKRKESSNVEAVALIGFNIKPFSFVLHNYGPKIENFSRINPRIQVPLSYMRIDYRDAFLMHLMSLPRNERYVTRWRGQFYSCFPVSQQLYIEFIFSPDLGWGMHYELLACYLQFETLYPSAGSSIRCTGIRWNSARIYVTPTTCTTTCSKIPSLPFYAYHPPT